MGRIRVVTRVTLEGPDTFEGRKIAKEEAAQSVLESFNEAFDELIDGATLDAVILSVEEIPDVRNQA